MGAHGNGAIRERAQGPHIHAAHTPRTYILHIHAAHTYPHIHPPMGVDAVGDPKEVIRIGKPWHMQGTHPHPPTHPH